MKTIASMITPEHVTALIVAVVSGIVIITYKWINPNNEAERHFIEHNNYAAYRVMEGCYIVILTAAVYNFRFLLFDAGQKAFASIAPLISLR